MDTEKKPGQVTAKYGRDVTKARIWVQVEGAREDVAFVLERVAAVVADAVVSEADSDTEQHYHTQDDPSADIKI